MWPPALFHLLLLAAAFLPLLLAIELPPPLAEQATGELDGILKAAQIEFTPISHDVAQAQDSAKSLITTTQKARIAIAKHVVDSTSLYTTRSAVTRAKALQDELMDRAQSHLVTQFDQRQGLEEVEWKLQHGFKDGVAETEDAGFTRQVLQPDKWKVAESKLDKDATLKQKLIYLKERIKEVLRNIDPLSATKRFRIRRLLDKLSTPPTPPTPPPPSTPPPTPSSNPTPFNMHKLRSRLSAITALKSTQSQSATSEAKHASAAALIENAPLIHSNIVLPPPPLKTVLQPQRMQKVVAGWKNRPGADGERAERSWIRTYLRTQGAGKADWNVPIPAPLPIQGVAR